MVEGPGCKVKGEVMKPRISGQRVKKIDGSATKSKSKMKKQKASDGEKSAGVEAGDPGSVFDIFLGKSCNDVQTLGKELFIFFEGSNQCLRLHFLMAGGFRVNGKTLDREGSSEKNAPTLILHLDRDIVTFSQSAADVRSAADCLAKIKRLQTLDICVSCFSHQRAVDVVASCQGRQVCDVLLDQEVLPGVGNIIKNEALFDSGIHPDTKIEVLTRSNVSHLVKMTRDFSMLFYKCRKEGHNLGRYLKIYRKAQCKQCGSKTVTTRMGDDSPRLTSFCPKCQTNDPQKLKTNRKLPTANSLLGWVTSGDSVEQVTEWTCGVCTLINPEQRTQCGACLTARQSASNSQPQRNPSEVPSRLPFNSQKSTSLSPSSNYGMGTHSLRSQKPLTVNGHVNMLTAKLPSRQTRDISISNHSENGNQPYAPRVSSLKSDSNDLSGSFDLDFDFDLTDDEGESQDASVPPPVKKQKILHSVDNYPSISSSRSMRVNPVLDSRISQSPHSANMSQQRQSKSVPCTTASQPAMSQKQPAVAVPTCAQHKLTCMMREVRKESSNKGRMFFSCPSKKCNLFQWADESFPICAGHGKRCAIRTVMKQGANNGRRFFACSQRKNKQCQFFQWGDEYNDITIR